MNRGEYTASWKKMLLTVINIGCVGIAGLIVRLPYHPPYAFNGIANKNSADWVSTPPASPSTTTPAATVSHARIPRNAWNIHLCTYDSVCLQR